MFRNKNQKPICKFYPNCKNGNNCNFQHIDNNNLGRGGGPGGHESSIESVSSFTNPNTLNNKLNQIKNDLQDYSKFNGKPLTSYGLAQPAVNNIISNRDLSFEESRLMYMEAVATNSVPEYEKQLNARSMDMDYCINHLRGKENLAARYSQQSVTSMNLPKPFIPKTIDENINEFMNAPTSSFGAPNAFGSQSGGFGSSQANPFGSQSNSLSANPFALNNQSSGFGSSGFGNSAFGSSGFGGSSGSSGTSAFGNSGFGNSGNSGSGNSGFGGSGFGSSGFGSSGFGGSQTKDASPAGDNNKSGFGGSGFGGSGFGGSSFGNSGFGSSGFGGSAFGNVNTSTNSGAFGQSAPNNNSSNSSGFGSSAFNSSGLNNSGFGSSGFGGSSFGNTGFGSSGFGNTTTNTSDSSGFNKPATSGFGSSGFGSSGFGSSGFGSSGFGSSNVKESPTPAAENKPASGFGSSFAANNTQTDTKPSPFGNVTKPETNNSNTSPFGQSGFGTTSNTSTTSQFGNTGFGSANKAQSPFASSNSAADSNKPALGISSGFNSGPTNQLKAENVEGLDIPDVFKQNAFVIGEVPDQPPPLEIC